MTGFTPAVVTRRRPAIAGSPWRPVAVAAACALGAVGAIAAPRIGIPVIIGVVVAASAGVLAVLALPSVPTRRATVLLLGIAGLGALRHAALPTTDSMLIVLWALATLATLVLADRADFEQSPVVAGSAPVASRTTETTRQVIAIAAIVAVVCVALVPVVTDKLGRSMWPGVVPTFGDALSSPTSLRSSGRIDMTERPRLTDKVVFTVDAPRADYWRGEVFDVWDGEAWTRSDRQQAVLPRTGDRVRIVTDPFDDGARTGETMRQTFHMESRFSELVLAAPSPVAVETDKQIVGRPDGTAMAVGGFGHHAAYTVTSRNALADADQLRAADPLPIPQEVATRYADVPVTTARVRALAQSVTAGQATDYDRIVALEAWLGAHTKYSLKAPLSPRGVDVVDHFLFTSREGWCEQVASSLVVLARSVGIPARLATGFVPGERDRLTGRFTVRERDAHAWTEVYFPGIGWQGFDPTASVPLAGEAPPSNSWFDTARRHALQFAIGLAIAVWAIVTAPDLWARLRRRHRRRTTWGARAFSRLERLGRRRGRPRRADETPSEYARALADHIDEPSLAQVGAVLDQEAFSTHEVSAERRATVDAVLTMHR